MAVEKPEVRSRNKGSSSKSPGKKRITPKRQKARVVRALKKKESKIVENTKQILLMKGAKVGEDAGAVLKDLVRSGNELSLISDRDST